MEMYQILYRNQAFLCESSNFAVRNIQKNLKISKKSVTARDRTTGHVKNSAVKLKNPYGLSVTNGHPTRRLCGLFIIFGSYL